MTCCGGKVTEPCALSSGHDGVCQCEHRQRARALGEALRQYGEELTALWRVVAAAQEVDRDGTGVERLREALRGLPAQPVERLG